MEGGYAMVNCAGLDLQLFETRAQLAGLRGKVAQAVSTGKPVVLYNYTNGTNPVTSPFFVQVTAFGTNKRGFILYTCADMIIYLYEDDTVQVVVGVGAD